MDSAPDYRPLLETWNVATLRYAAGRALTSSGGGVVLCNPEYPPQMKRRYPDLITLPGGEEEAGVVLRAIPGSRVLRGPAATQANLEAAWGSAGFLYVASHFIQVAETPYLSFLPLAAPDESPIEASLLDYGEIREADFAGCALVVLSGCGTGVGYSSGRVAGPSLGDAFLDAGAGAVVQTLWRVRDDEGAALSRELVGAWARGAPPVAALSTARRAAWGTGAGNPAWLAYAVTLSDFP